MATTIRTRSFAFTAEMEKQIEFLREELGESNSQIIKKALNSMYISRKTWKDPNSFKGILEF